jgi:serine phosphatase RsbU (regulator of sigma subunit)
MMMVNALISGFSLTDTNGANILAKTNAILKPRVKQNMMMTCLLVRWNEAEKKLYMTGAGHEYLIIYKSNGTIQKIKTGGVALGMVKDISKALREENIQIDIDDIIVLYTDGITEARLNSKQD